MALTQDERYILVAILASLMIFVLYFETRIMRGKAKEARRGNLRKDSAFNAILTTRSVINTIQNQGRDTGNAPRILESAKSALQQGDYDHCMDLCEKARVELTNPKRVRKLAVEDEEGALDAEARLEAVAEDVLSEDSASSREYKGTTLSAGREGNYLGAKFELAAAKADIGRAAKDGRDTLTAEGLLMEAEAAFTGGNYDKTLSFAVRARKAVSSETAREAIPLRVEKAAPTPEPEVFDVEEAEAPVPKGPKCKACGSHLEPGDAFCPKCGAKVARVRKCPSCGVKPRQEDLFCRKCGSKID